MKVLHFEIDIVWISLNSVYRVLEERRWCQIVNNCPERKKLVKIYVLSVVLLTISRCFGV